MQVYGMTDRGQVREINEDSYGIYGFSGGDSRGFCIIADGMGGHNAGEVASSTAVSYVADELKAYIDKNLQAKDLQILLAGSIKAANSRIHRMADMNISQKGMGTTLVVVYVMGTSVYIANVGDSRVYLVKNDDITQLTVDHSVVEELVSNGTITRDEAAQHPQKHVITRALGTDEDILVDVYEYKYDSGDIIIMCTDGLTEMMPNEDIKLVCESSGDIRGAVEELINRANRDGGVDNITVVGMKF